MSAQTQKSRPLLFSGQMVRAILSGRKTATRRLGDKFSNWSQGDQIWVKETCGMARHGIVYRADLTPQEEGELYEQYTEWKWKPSIFMPRESSRILLRVTGTAKESLHNMCESDAHAEGFDGIEGFIRLWNKINPAATWESNPDVWVIRFELCR